MQLVQLDGTKKGERVSQEVPIIQVFETDTIEARFAELPIIDMSRRFLVQVMKPVPLIPMEKKIPFKDKQKLEDILLEEWTSHVKDAPKDSWMHNVNKVELIGCDLLVPKK
jgi:hypothetical protein